MTLKRREAANVTLKGGVAFWEGAQHVKLTVNVLELVTEWSALDVATRSAN